MLHVTLFEQWRIHRNIDLVQGKSIQMDLFNRSKIEQMKMWACTDVQTSPSSKRWLRSTQVSGSSTTQSPYDHTAQENSFQPVNNALHFSACTWSAGESHPSASKMSAIRSISLVLHASLLSTQRPLFPYSMRRLGVDMYLALPFSWSLLTTHSSHLLRSD